MDDIYLNLDVDRAFTEKVKLTPGASPDPAHQQWLTQLRCYCCTHPDEFLEPYASSEDILLSGDHPAAREMFAQMRRFARSEADPLHTDAPSVPSENTYEFRARFRKCPQCHLREIGVPPLFLASRFERFIADTDELRQNLAKCQEFAASARGFLFLLGLVGTGKSFLAAAILRARCRRGDRYFRHLDLINWLRASYHRPASRSHDEESDIQAVCQEASLLVIDEFGVATGGNDTEVLLYNILDHRYTHLQPTILCTNLPADDFKALTGERLTDRFREASFAILNFNSPSKRASLNADYLARCAPRN